jgi:hypothetical protein
MACPAHRPGARYCANIPTIDPPDGLEKKSLSIDKGFTAGAQRSGTWVRDQDGQQVVFLPFHQVQNERYTTYFNRG